MISKVKEEEHRNNNSILAVAMWYMYMYKWPTHLLDWLVMMISQKFSELPLVAVDGVLISFPAVLLSEALSHH